MSTRSNEPAIWFTATQLAANPFFQEWVFDPGSPQADYWERQLVEGSPEQNIELLSARNRLLRFVAGTQACVLTRSAAEHYVAMKQELRLIDRQGWPPVKAMESGFDAMQFQWGLLRQHLLHYVFATTEQEIHFFKVMKPLLTHELEYYRYRYNAQLFCNDTLPEDQLKFWRREKKRREKFIAEETDFYTAYTGGNTTEDDVWYARAIDGEDSSPCDGLVTTWLALERYEALIKTKLAELE